MINKKIPDVIGIFGIPGTGKTTLANLIAHTVNSVPINKFCPDINEISLSGDGGVDNIRNIISRLKFKPTYKKRFIIGDEAHGLTTQAKSTLLKPLENMPDHAVFIFVTDQPEKLPSSITSRCFKLYLNIPKPEDVAIRLKQICKAEKVKVKEKYLLKIAEAAGGIPRESIQVLSAYLNLIEDKEDKKEIKKLLSKTISSILNTDLDKSAVNYLYGVYSEDINFALKSLDGLNDIVGFTSKLLEFNRYFIELLSDLPTYHSYVRKNMVTMFKKDKIDMKLSTCLKVHKKLVNLRAAVATFLVNDYHTLLAHSYDLLVRKD
jgi:DNA polymerase-3 subunit gamma/tau